MKKILFPSFVALLLMMTSCEQVVPPVLGALEVEVSSERISCSVEVVEGTIDDCGFYYSTSKASVMNNNHLRSGVHGHQDRRREEQGPG